MRERWLPVIGALVFLAAQGCAGMSDKPAPAAAQPAHPADPMLDMLNAHLNQLENSLNGLDKRLAAMKAQPEHEDPIFREIRALDLAGWELHRQQWMLQRDHLRFAERQLQRVKEHPEQKLQIRDEWVKGEQEFEAALEGFRKQRHDLEHKRLQAEAQLVEQHLR